MKSNSTFVKNLKYLGFEQDNESLYLCSDIDKVKPEIRFHLEIAKEIEATAVFFKKEIEFLKHQVYIYDYTGQGINETILTDIHRKIWTSGNVPLVCVFYDTEIKILNTTTHIVKDKPNYIEVLKLTEKIKGIYNNQFAIKIKTGVFWEEEENKKRFSFTNSSYDILIKHIQNLIKTETAKLKTNFQVLVLKKLIIKCILIRFLEEKDPELFRKNYFNNTPFVDLIDNFENLNNIFSKLELEFNGNIFSFSEKEKNQLKELDLNSISIAFRGDIDDKKQYHFWDLYDFKYIPTELISRLYEEFLAGKDNHKTQKEKKQSDGIYYTPAHLAKLLVNEAMPLSSYSNVDLKKYKILDPACGSGIFLVLTFKRLIQWWRLQQFDKFGDFGVKPNAKELKELLSCIYGVDKEEQATKLTTFSLCIALCDELSPMQIIKKLKFDDLTQTNILYSDFFIEELPIPEEEKKLHDYEKQKQNFSKINNLKFDLVIGNPPFKFGAIKQYSNIWKEENIKVPQGQIALKFLVDTIPRVKKGGVQCLIIKSSGLLYNNTSSNFKTKLFTNYNVKKVFDFTALARNNCLWENGADVATAAIFIKNEEFKENSNILHLTFRRNKATTDKITFEIDTYDKFYIERYVAIINPYIWKINLLGGGRIKSIIDKTKNINSFQKYLKDNNCLVGEGIEISETGNLNPEFLYRLPTLLTDNINEEGIDYESLTYFDRGTVFVRVQNEHFFTAPNLILWENIGKNKLPVFLNNISFTFKRKLIGIKCDKNIDILKQIKNELERNSNFYRFYIFCISGQLLINKNTAILQKDYLSLPFLLNKDIVFSDYDINVINDILNYTQLSIREGENSKAFKKIPIIEIKKTLHDFGLEFSKVLNLVYENNGNKFRLSNIISLFDNTYIITVFKYDDSKEISKFEISKFNDLNINNLTIEKISTALSINRIITLYEEDTIIFIKPNQYRYWLTSIAYRDADNCFSDLVKAGF